MSIVGRHTAPSVAHSRHRSIHRRASTNARKGRRGIFRLFRRVEV